MSSVVYSEGINDVYLLSDIHQREGINREYQTFLSEDTEESQTKVLRQFMVDDRFEIIYKSEEGVSNLIKKFRSHSLTFTQFSLYLLIDLDGGPIDDFFAELNGKLHEHYGNKVKVVKGKQSSNQDMVFIDCTLRLVGGENKPIPVMAFYESLEDVAGIRDTEPRAQKHRKISTYLDKNSNISADIAGIIG